LIFIIFVFKKTDGAEEDFYSGYSVFREEKAEKGF
jgi:hypothetical protein